MCRTRRGLFFPTYFSVSSFPFVPCWDAQLTMALLLSRSSRFFHRCYHSNKLQRRVSTPSFLPSHRLKPKHSSSSQLRNLSTQPWQDEDLPPDPIPLHLHHHGNGVHSSRTHRIHGLVSKPCPKVGRLVLVRHGQSVWNVTDPTRDLTARFVSHFNH